MSELLISVDAERLNQLLWNAALFTSKTGVTEGKVLFSVRDWHLFVLACDDFIIMQDRADFRLGESENAVVVDDWAFTLALSDVKALETETRKVTEGTIDLFFQEDRLLCLGQDIQTAKPSDIWKTLGALSGRDWDHMMAEFDCYLNPDRMKQIPRMKIKGDHPVGFRFSMHEGNIMVPFIYGPTVRGVITSMDEQVLRERGVHIWQDKWPESEGWTKVGEVDPDSPPWDEDE